VISWVGGSDHADEFSTLTSPSGRSGCGVWASNGTVWMFGGKGMSVSSPTHHPVLLNDVWTFTLTDTSWHQVGGSYYVDDDYQTTVMTTMLMMMMMMMRMMMMTTMMTMMKGDDANNDDDDSNDDNNDDDNELAKSDSEWTM
jgi:hypothetical protein